MKKASIVKIKIPDETIKEMNFFVDEIIKDNLIPKILNIENSIRIKTY